MSLKDFFLVGAGVGSTLYLFIATYLKQNKTKIYESVPSEESVFESEKISHVSI